MPKYSYRIDAALLKSSERYGAETERREQTLSTARVFEIHDSRVKIKALPEGSIWGVIGTRGSGAMAALAEAVETANYDLLDRLARAQSVHFTTAGSTETLPVTRLSHIPILADLVYGERSVAPGLSAVSGLDVLIAVMPYTGGKLNYDKFLLAQYPLPSVAPDLDCIVIVRHPALSDVEKDIFSRVPGESSEEFVGNAGSFIFPGIFVAAYVGYKVAQFIYNVVHDLVTHQNQGGAAVQDQNIANQIQAANDDGPSDDGPSPILGAYFLKPEVAATLETIDPAAAADVLLALRSELIRSQLLD